MGIYGYLTERMTGEHPVAHSTNDIFAWNFDFCIGVSLRACQIVLNIHDHDGNFFFGVAPASRVTTTSSYQIKPDWRLNKLDASYLVFSHQLNSITNCSLPALESPGNEQVWFRSSVFPDSPRTRARRTVRIVSLSSYGDNDNSKPTYELAYATHSPHLEATWCSRSQPKYVQSK